jgi:transposase InsO family protein
MSQWTTIEQRQAFYGRHQAGETYPEIAEAMGVSVECVRYWCRRQQAGGPCQTVYPARSGGLLSRFEAKVRYAILRLRLEHPRWGPNRILMRLKKRPSLRGLGLPKEAQIGRYLHQWPRFRRPTQTGVRTRPDQPQRVHQRWQIDFKMGIGLNDGSQVNLHTVRDPVGEAALTACVFAAGRVGQPPAKVTLSQVQTVLRRCFKQWATLPQEVQTDGETSLVGQPQGDFPSVFTLWLKGLGIAHRVSRPGQPTDNAEVERCHRTLNDYAIVGNQKADLSQLQALLDEAVHELAFELPSRAQGCAGRPPALAHPELLQPPRPFQPELELAHFQLKRVDAYLATFTWTRTVSKTGQVDLGGYRYSVGRPFARRQVAIRFDPTRREFVFDHPDAAGQELKRRPARGLQVTDLTGLAQWPLGLGHQQLPLPWPALQGVNC